MTNKYATQYDISYSEYLKSVINNIRVKGIEKVPCRMKIEYCYNLNKSVEYCVNLFL
jgi:hypothetical protein